jgi:hypothetical protein
MAAIYRQGGSFRARESMIPEEVNNLVGWFVLRWNKTCTKRKKKGRKKEKKKKKEKRKDKKTWSPV